MDQQIDYLSRGVTKRQLLGWAVKAQTKKLAVVYAIFLAEFLLLFLLRNIKPLERAVCMVLLGLCVAWLLGAMAAALRRSFLLLRQQEEELNFSFDWDAGEVPVGKTSAVDGRWFISWEDGAVVAFRRDFVRETREIDQTVSGGRTPVITYTLTVIDYQRRYHQVHASQATLTQLKRWADEVPAAPPGGLLKGGSS